MAENVQRARAVALRAVVPIQQLLHLSLLRRKPRQPPSAQRRSADDASGSGLAFRDALKPLRLGC